MDNTFVKMLSDFGDHKSGEVYEIDNETATKWINAKLAEATEDPQEGLAETITKLFDERDQQLAKSLKATVKAPRVITDEVDKVKGLGHFFQLAAQALGRVEVPSAKTEASKTKAFQQLDNVYKSTLSTAQGSTGGILTPEKFINELYTMPGYTPEFMQRTVQIPVENSETVVLPALDQSITPDGKGQTAWGAGVKITGTKQDTKSAETALGLREIKLHPERKSANIPVSNHLLRNSAIGVENIVKRLFNMEVNAHIEYNVLLGNGASNPLGILSDTNLMEAVTRDTSTEVRYSDLCDMWQELPAWGHKTAIWMIGQKTVSQFLQMTTDSTNGVPVFHPSAHDGINMTLFNRPVFVSEFLPALGTAKDVVLLDPAMYYTAISLQPIISMSDQVEWLEDNTVFKIEMWVDGQPAYNYKPILADGTTTVSPAIYLAA